MHKALLLATNEFENSSPVSLPFMVRVAEHLDYNNEKGMQTPEILVRVLRARHCGSTDLFRFATYGNIEKLQYLFSKGEASSSDVQRNGRNALHVS
jgi:hypothetical protein